MTNTLRLGAHRFSSRLLTGTGRFPSLQSTVDALTASGSELCTVALRRLPLDRPDGSALLKALPSGMKILPNTAGATTAKEAVRIARLAREALETDLVKLEILADPVTLYPHNAETLRAAITLVDEGFTVLPYCGDDPVICRELEAVGCAAVMPLAAPIGSGLGLLNPQTLSLIRELIEIPMIVDAGIGSPADALQAMELGCDAVLVNTAIAAAKEPIGMATAFRLAVEAGRLSFLSGRIPRRRYATASSPSEGLSTLRIPNDGDVNRETNHLKEDVWNS
ncbi:MAG: thiazole synthase [Myxococcales bacterium]|nr:thiazole synthase [Myxococcales bacterium]